MMDSDLVVWFCRYVPYVADSKRAMDEYTSEIFLGGKNTIVMHNTCEDSLLAAPIILDLVLLAELLTRIELKKVTALLADRHSAEAALFHGLCGVSWDESAWCVSAMSKCR